MYNLNLMLLMYQILFRLKFPQAAGIILTDSNY